MNALTATHDAAVQMIDTSVVRVHQHGACIAGNKEQHMGRSRGGLTSKVHAVADTDDGVAMEGRGDDPSRHASPDCSQTSRSRTKRAFFWMKSKRSSGRRPIRLSTRSSVALKSTLGSSVRSGRVMRRRTRFLGSIVVARR